MSLTRLIILGAPGEAAAYRVVDGAGVLERGLVAGTPVPHPELRTVVVVPGVDVLCRWLALPRGQDAQVAAAAALMLEDELAEARAELHVALGRTEADGTRLVAVVARDRMRAWLDAAAALGVRPDVMCPGQLMLPEPDDGDVVAAVVDDTALVRGHGLALACDAELLPVVMRGRAYALVDGAEAERVIAVAAAHPPLDLQQGAFSSRASGTGRGRGARIAILAGLLAACLLALPVVRAGRAEWAIHQDAQAIYALAGEPRAASADEAIRRLRTRATRIRAAEAFPARASALFAAVQGVEGMEVQTLLYDQDGALRATLSHVNYSDVEQLRRSLAGADLTLEEKSAVVDQGRVLSDITVRGRP